MNAGRPARRDPPHRGRPRPPARPALPPARLRRARVRGPQRLAPLRRVVGRQPRRRSSRPPKRPWPASWPHLAGGAGVLADRAVALARVGHAEGSRRRRRPLRLAGHLAELAALAAPADPGVHRVRAEVFARLSETATSTMAKGRVHLDRPGLRGAGPTTRSEAARPTTTRGSRLASVVAVSRPRPPNRAGAARVTAASPCASGPWSADRPCPSSSAGASSPPSTAIAGRPNRATTSSLLCVGTIIAAIVVGRHRGRADRVVGRPLPQAVRRDPPPVPVPPRPRDHLHRRSRSSWCSSSSASPCSPRTRSTP